MRKMHVCNMDVPTRTCAVYVMSLIVIVSGADSGEKCRMSIAMP